MHSEVPISFSIAIGPDCSIFNVCCRRFTSPQKKSLPEKKSGNGVKRLVDLQLVIHMTICDPLLQNTEQGSFVTLSICNIK